MDNSDKEEFANIICEALDFYEKTCSKRKLYIWFKALKKYNIEDISRALTAHLLNPDHGQFVPKPADIVRGIDGDIKSTALKAWTQVDRTVRTVGPYRSIVFDDAITMQVIDDMGGWVKLCMTTNNDLPFRANEFSNRYYGYINSGLRFHPKILPGLFEFDGVREVVYIGDKEKCTNINKLGDNRKLLIHKI